ncbi:putative F-box protein [Cladorrhinum samala]|uniref:F-box protein n=1 Tax=Cladorrhinum samala TaxID=585594 RepID=A0AAV9HBV0_9PEZI|nr:putative F-box protein [Cladorrhinum samala]
MAVSKPGPAHLHLPYQPLRTPSRDCSPDYLTMDSRSSTPDRVSRSSFSSIRENESTLPQTFSSTKISSYLDHEDAIDDCPPPTPSPTDSASSFNRDHKMIQTQTVTAHFKPPVTHPNSKLLGYWTPADSFKGWKEIQVKGKISSRSFGDLQVLHQSFKLTPKPPKRTGPKPGEAPIERLPTEIITSIIELLALDVPPNGVARRNIDLMSLLLTSRTLHIATLTTLYSKITIPHSRIFQKFLAHISDHPTLGTIVRRLDFCHFNPAQLFLTAAERSKARNLTSETLLRCLELTPNLQEFLGQEYIDEDLDANVLQKLFLGLPRLQAVDFCGCTSTSFKESLTSIVSPDWPSELSIRRLSLHKCLTLPSSVFEIILPRLPLLTHLDVAGTRITDAALASIPPTAKLTHLNLAKCTLLSARGVIDFLAHHPAAKGLVYLSLATDARSHQLFDVEGVTELLSVLPKTLKSLSLKGNRMDASHIDLLRPLTKHLEELSIGRSLSLRDVNRLFVPEEDGNDENSIQMQLDWVPHTLKYLDLSDLWGAELDLVYLFSSNCAILRAFSDPLEVVEIAEDVFKRVNKSAAAVERAGWRLSECGIRGWMVRQPPKDLKAAKKDDGRRSWKMGADSWGMRKIPVARSDVGGMYGSYMFGRKL